MTALQISTEISTAVENLRALLIDLREGERIIACRKTDFKRFVVNKSNCRRGDGPPGGPSPFSLEVEAYPEFRLETSVALEIEYPGDIRPVKPLDELDMDGQAEEE